jgi:hypothetical protein
MTVLGVMCIVAGAAVLAYTAFEWLVANVAADD